MVRYRSSPKIRSHLPHPRHPNPGAYGLIPSPPMIQNKKAAQRLFCWLMSEPSDLVQIGRERLFECVPNLGGVRTILPDQQPDGIRFAFSPGKLGQLLVKRQRTLTGRLLSKIVAANPGIELLKTIEDQSINRIPGGKCQLVVKLIIKLGECFGIVAQGFGLGQ